jgi:uncharacterized protein
VATDDERCAEAKKFGLIDDAFRRGDLEGLREAVGDPTAVPNGRMPDAIGSCLVYAIYHSPLAFIRALLEAGADPNASVNDGFPPLIAALSCARAAPGAAARSDVDDILRLLLSFGADPNQRGLNDYTPLHVAVAEKNPLAMQILLDGGADPELRTRIDACETPREMAEAAGLADIAAMLTRKQRPFRKRLRSGLALLADFPGSGEPVRRQHRYRIQLRLWLNKGQAVRWHTAWGPVGLAQLSDDGATLMTEVRIDRRSLVAGLFYGVEGMRVGGTRRLEIAPHLAYGDRGVPGVIPAEALLISEITRRATQQPVLGKTRGLPLQKRKTGPTLSSNCCVRRPFSTTTQPPTPTVPHAHAPTSGSIQMGSQLTWPRIPNLEPTNCFSPAPKPNEKRVKPSFAAAMCVAPTLPVTNDRSPFTSGMTNSRVKSA